MQESSFNDLTHEALVDGCSAVNYKIYISAEMQMSTAATLMHQTHIVWIIL